MDFQCELQEALRTFAVSGGAGAVGGFVAGINAATNNTVRLLRIGRKDESRTPLQLDLGFFGDMLVGGAAGIAIVFFIYIVGTQDPNASPRLLRLIPISLMAGIVSKRALAGMADAVIGKIAHLEEEQIRLEDRVKKLASIRELVREGEDYLHQGASENADRAERVGKYESARDKFAKALEIDPNHPVANLSLGRALKRLSTETEDQQERRKLLQKAIDATSKAINSDPANERAYYNRACYKAVLGVDVSETIGDLEKAIQLFSQNRSFAESDSDFDKIRSNPKFKSLVDGADTGRTTSPKVG